MPQETKSGRKETPKLLLAMEASVMEDAGNAPRLPDRFSLTFSEELDWWTGGIEAVVLLDCRVWRLTVSVRISSPTKAPSTLPSSLLSRSSILSFHLTHRDQYVQVDSNILESKNYVASFSKIVCRLLFTVQGCPRPLHRVHGGLSCVI